MIRRGRGYREGQAGLPPSGASETKLKIAWLHDRIRRATAALAEIEEIANAHCQASPAAADMFQTIIDVARRAIEAEKADAAR